MRITLALHKITSWNTIHTDYFLHQLFILHWILTEKGVNDGI